METNLEILSQREEFFRAWVLELKDESVVLEINENNQNKFIDAQFPGNLNLTKGQQVVVSKFNDTYTVSDIYRLDNVLALLGLFFLAVIILARTRGIGSIIGMAVSLFIIAGFIVPQILGGGDALLISILGSIAIMTSTIYLAHGFSWRTTLALGSTMLVLIGVGVLSILAVDAAFLTGLGSEEAYTLFSGIASGVNFKGLLLGGIIIGSMGVLDDVTTSLAATVFELHKANPKLKFGELFNSAMNVGREHITSLVNTLVLAYAGAALPIFIFLVSNPSGYPMWQILNSEMLVEEVVRTIAGSMGLVMAVPITAAITAGYVKRKAYK